MSFGDNAANFRSPFWIILTLKTHLSSCRQKEEYLNWFPYSGWDAQDFHMVFILSCKIFNDVLEWPKKVDDFQSHSCRETVYFESYIWRPKLPFQWKAFCRGNSMTYWKCSSSWIPGASSHACISQLITCHTLKNQSCHTSVFQFFFSTMTIFFSFLNLKNLLE